MTATNTSRKGELRAAAVAFLVLALATGAFSLFVDGEAPEHLRAGAPLDAIANDDASTATAGSALVAANGEHAHESTAAHDDHVDGPVHDTEHEGSHAGGALGASHAHAGATTPGSTASHGDHAHGPAPVAGATTTPTSGHDHAPGATTGGTTTPTTGHTHPPSTTTPTGGTTTPTTVHVHDPCAVEWDHDAGHGGHGDGPNVQMAELVRCYPNVANQIQAVTAWAMQFSTTAAAKAGGWNPATVYFPGIAAHWVAGDPLSLITLDDVFDPAKPEILLYGKDGDLVGINYIVKSGSNPPAGFEGDWDVWHEHKWLCVDLAKLLVISEQGPATCPGFAFDFSGHWLLHVWSIPGWESPEGIFSHENSKV